MPRSSSAVLVAVRGPRESPRLLDRRQLELVGDQLPAQAYHAAATLDLDEASRVIQRWTTAASTAADRGITDVLSGPAKGYRVVGAGIVATVREIPTLATVLRSHPLLHTAEGQLAREVLAEAAERARLSVHYLAPKGPHEPEHAELAEAMRHEAGAPWRKEHKLATIAALAVLSSR